MKLIAYFVTDNGNYSKVILLEGAEAMKAFNEYIESEQVNTDYEKLLEKAANVADEDALMDHN